MENTGEHIASFFKAYEALVNRSLKESPDVEAIMKAFASCFIEATPAGVICGNNDNSFRKMIPQGYAFYQSIGTQKMTILSLEITLLNELHYMTKVNWSALYRNKEGRETTIEFPVIYFTQNTSGAPKIFAYIAGDEQKLLRENGIIFPDE